MDEDKVIGSYRVAEFVSRSSDGAPLCWPLFPELVAGKVAFSTPYVMPTKASNARRDPQVAVLFSDPTASGRSDSDPLVLIQGRAEVLDVRWQDSADRYVDQILRLNFGPPSGRLLLRTPGLRQAAVGYLTRTWIEVHPERTLSWPRTGPTPDEFEAVRPDGYEPGQPITISDTVRRWVQGYPRPPVLAFITASHQPAAIRSRAQVDGSGIALGEAIRATPGAPAALTFHKVRGNHRSSSSFMVRGHLDGAGRLIPERIVGNSGTTRDHLTGTVELFRLALTMGTKLRAEAARSSQPLPRIRRVRATPGRVARSA